MGFYFEIGKIVNTQGIKGDVRVLPTTDDPTRFELLEEVEVFTNSARRIFLIERVWYHKSFVILKLKGIDDMTAAEKLKNSVIKIPSEKALPLDEDEYYLRDLYGMEVVTGEGERLGVIADIIFTGANDVYVVRGEDQKQILIPAIKQCILKVDTAARVMTVALLEGLRD